MKPIDRGEVLSLAEYEPIRDRFRARVVAEKKLRRVVLGPKASVVFENRDTALLQIQEMLRTERITRPAAVQHEIDTYNELVPGDGELSCTLMIEVADKEDRDAFLASAKGLEHHVWLVVGETRIGAREADRGVGPDDRTTAVHYLKFSLPAALVEQLRTGHRPPVELVVDHRAYQARAVLSAATVAQVVEDLSE